MDMEARRKQVSLVEQEFRLLQKVPLQRHLVPYVAFKFEVVDQQLHVYAAEEFVHGISLNFYLQVRSVGNGASVKGAVTHFGNDLPLERSARRGPAWRCCATSPRA